MSNPSPVPAVSNTFERIKRINPAGAEFWSSRDFALVLGYTDYRNFEAVIEKARAACFNSGQRVEDHFVEINEMIEIGNRALRFPRPAGLQWRIRSPVVSAGHESHFQIAAPYLRR